MMKETQPNEAETPQPTKRDRARHHLKHWGKWTHRLIYVGVLIPIVLVLGFAGAIHFMDFNQYKPQLEAEFKKQTGYDLSVEGNVDVSVWPFSLSAQNATVASPKGFERPLVEMEQVEVTLSLWSLFVQQRLQASGVELIGPRINLIETDAGQRNFKGLVTNRWLKRWQVASAQSSIAMPGGWLTAQAHAASESQRWDLDAFVVRDGSLRWKTPARTWQWDHIALMAYDLRPEQPAEVQLSARMDIQGVDFQTQFDARGQMTFTPSMQRLALSDWQAHLRLTQK
jgi:AsmA protein